MIYPSMSAHQPKWDKYETALLIEAYWKIKANPSQKNEIVVALSSTLRKRASFDIDDIFRNENGMNMRLAELEYVFSEGKAGFNKTSRLFHEMADLYLNNRNEFDKILAEAKGMNSGTSNIREQFCEWLKENAPELKSEPEDVCKLLTIAEKSCKKMRVLNVQLFETTDVDVVQKFVDTISHSVIFRIRHKEHYETFLSAAKMYLFFVQDFTKLSSPTQNEETEQELPANSSTSDNSQTDETIVSFKEKPRYSFTKPQWFRYKDKDRETVNSWANLYTRVMIRLAEDYSDLFYDGMSVSGGKRIDVVKNSESGRFIRYSQLTNDLVIDTNYSANDLVNLIAEMASKVGLTEKDIEIHYFKPDYTGKSNTASRDTNSSEHSISVDLETSKSKATSGSTLDYSNTKPLWLGCNIKIKDILKEYFTYGFNIESPIELIKFKRKYAQVHGQEVELADDGLIEEIKQCGIEYLKKIYIVSEEAINRLVELMRPYIETGNLIFYYTEIYNKNENWLFEERIVSSDMLKMILERKLPSYQHRSNFFIARSNRINEREALILDIENVWGDAVLRSFSELSERLPYIPLDKIKYALTVGEQFIWNSLETYTRKQCFKCSDEQLDELREAASRLCSEKGSATFEELPADDLLSENYELSETAAIDIIFSLLSDEYDRNQKAITKKGEKIDIQKAIIQHFGLRDSCTLSEVERFSMETVGEVRNPVIVEAINKVMVRIDGDNFVTDKMVKFECEVIDNALNTIVKGNVIGMKEINTFGIFPYCGYKWNLFLLESFCRRFSRTFRYGCATANSNNAGAIIRKSFKGSYHEAMAEAVANSTINLNDNEVFDFLVSSGLMSRRKYSEMDDLIKRAVILREGRN